ncbi:MAG: prepilin-type N-terminal cleavage/methylation domain-containing protein [Verrucomicrobiota bacterium]
MIFHSLSPASLRAPSRLTPLGTSSSVACPPSSAFRPPSAAFTLVELLIGAALSAAVLAAVLSSYLYLGRNLTRLANQQALETQSRRALGYFTQDVQRASGIDTTQPLNASRVSLTVPTATGSTTVTYYYNADLTDTATVTINGTNVTMPAASLTRCVYNGSTVTSLTLLRHITDGDTDEADNDLKLRYYDASGNEYTAYTDYLPGIKQLSLEFKTQTGVANIGTQTLVHNVASSRLALRNRGFLQ